MSMNPAVPARSTHGSDRADVLAAVERYPHTELFLGSGVVGDVSLRFADVSPIHRAFAPMVREQRYDVCELALVTLLQAIEARVPIVPLPLVLHGNFHHRSIWTLGGRAPLRPTDLRGRRVGVRAYSQTTALWVRSVLSADFGVDATDVTWITREGPHVAEAVDPVNVEHSDTPLVDALRSGEVDAVVMGARSVDHVPDLVPLIPDWQSRQQDFHDRQGWVPINHLAVVSRELLGQRPDAVREIYDLLAGGIRSTAQVRVAGPVSGRAVVAGIGDQLLAPLDAAIDDARAQNLISADIRAADLFDDFRQCIGES